MKFNIRKDHFSSGIHFGLHNKRVSQTYKVRFDSSCLYEDIDWERDWNKLDGWSYSNLPFKTPDRWEPGHHLNSIRLAWRANKSTNKIELALYYYQEGVRNIVDFTSIEVNEDYTLGIFYKFDSIDGDIQNPRIILTCTQKDIQNPFFDTKTIALIKPFIPKLSYKLFPYFGGSNPAPQDMFILSEET